MRVVLVNPNYNFWKPGSEFILRAIGQQAPLGLLSLASYVTEHLAEIWIGILDARPKLLSTRETVKRILAMRPDLVGITMTTVLVHEAETIAESLKEVLPHVKIIAGGPHVSGTGGSILERCAVFDAAVFGEGEVTFGEILKAVRDDKSMEGMPGVICRNNDGVIVRSLPRELIEDLDSLPMLNWNLLPGFPEDYPSNIFFSPGGAMATLTTSRGCPFRCRFCDQSTFGHRFRASSAQRIVADVCRLREGYSVEYVVFCDDTFTLDRERVLEICDRLSRLKHNVAWSCDANVMTVDSEMLRAMKKAGCWSVSYGIESGSETVLRSIGKNIDIGRAYEVIRETREAGIHAKGLFILGTPEESKETIKETLHFIRSAPISSLNLSKFTPYPGTAIESKIDHREAIDYSMLNGMRFVLGSRHLSIQELEEGYETILREFYNTFRSWRFHMSLALQSKNHVRRFFGILPDVLCQSIQARVNRGRREGQQNE